MKSSIWNFSPKGVHLLGFWVFPLVAFQAESRIRVVRIYIRKVGTELYCVTTLEKCTIG